MRFFDLRDDRVTFRVRVVHADEKQQHSTAKAFHLIPEPVRRVKRRRLRPPGEVRPAVVAGRQDFRPFASCGQRSHGKTHASLQHPPNDACQPLMNGQNNR